MVEDVTRIWDALDLLRKPSEKTKRPHSWTRQTERTKDGERHCIIGALVETHGGYDPRHHTIFDSDSYRNDRMAILSIIKDQFPRKNGSRIRDIPTFNDNPRRKFEDVELVLEKAAIMREEQGAKVSEKL